MVVAEREEGGRKDVRVSDEARKGAEKKTEVVFLFGGHTVDYVDKMKELTKKKLPDVVVLEEPESENFRRMLKGEVTVQEYVRSRGYTFKEAAIARCELVVELHKKGVKVEQIDPGHGIAWVHYPSSLTFESAAEERIMRHIKNGEFEKGVNAIINSMAIMAVETKKRDEMRAEEIARRIQNGELKGYVLVEAGSIHTKVKNILRERFKGSDEVEVKSEFARKENANEVFGRWALEVYSPLNELHRIYKNGLEGELDQKWMKKWGKRWRREGGTEEFWDERGRLERLGDRVSEWFDRSYGGERERLLAARAAVMLRAGGLEDDLKEMKIARMANKLNYDECKKVFEEMRGMDEEAAFKFLEGYLKNRKK